MKRILIACALSLLPVVAAAQPIAIDHLTPPFSNETAQKWAGAISWGTALTAVALDAKSSWDSPERGRAFLLQGARIGVTYGVGYAVKTLTQRDRPCAPGCGVGDSFYSLHTALAFQSLGGPRLAFTLPLSFSTAGLRIGADKHWLSDTIVGGIAGALTAKIR